MMRKSLVLAQRLSQQHGAVRPMIQMQQRAIFHPFTQKNEVSSFYTYTVRSFGPKKGQSSKDKKEAEKAAVHEEFDG